MRRGWSLRSRLTVTVAGLVLAMACVLGALLPDRMDQLARSGLERRGAAIASIVAASVVPALDFDDAATAQEQLRHLQGTADARWAGLWRADGQRLAAWGPAPLHLPEPGLHEGSGVAIFVRSVAPPTGRQGQLAVGLSTDALLAQKRTNQLTIAMIAGLLVILGALGASVVGGHLTEPIRSVTRAALRVAGGERDVDALGLDPHEAWRHDADETRQLTLAVSDMARQLTQQLDQIEQERGRALEAEQLARQASRTKSVFLANMSHELRTPLNAILGYTELIEEESRLAGHHDHLDDLGRISTAGGHLLGLINDLLDLAKIEAGSMTLVVEVVDAPGLIAEVVRTVRPLVEQNGNQLGVEVSADLGLIRSDAQRLRQILLNLLSNAAKFTVEGHISLSAGRQGTDVWFSVADTGIGIDPEQLVRLFQPFQQADASTTKRYGGTGLGLSLVKHLSELLSGTVSVQSRPTAGSTFTVRLADCAIRSRRASAGGR